MEKMVEAIMLPIYWFTMLTLWKRMVEAIMLASDYGSNGMVKTNRADHSLSILNHYSAVAFDDQPPQVILFICACICMNTS